MSISPPDYDKVLMNKTERKTKRATAADEGAASEEARGSSSAGGSTAGDPLVSELLGLDQIKELIELIAARDFNEFELQRGSFRLRLLRGVRAAETPADEAHSTPTATAAAPPVAPAVQAPVEEALHIVSSPIVGTYYGAPSPASPPFVGLGEAVQSGQTLCIIEAMKLMNEIQSDASGTVAKIFVENGQPVEFGQPLFGIRIG